MSTHCEGHSCSIDGASSSVRQTLEEMDFERGIWFAAQQNDSERVENLLKKGTPVDMEDLSGYTALHYAARNGHILVSKKLLDNGANVDAKTRSGQATSLHRAASQGHVAIVELLLKFEANPDVKDADGLTALHRAVKANASDVCKVLIHKTDLKIVDNQGRSFELFANEFGNEDISNLFRKSN